MKKRQGALERRSLQEVTEAIARAEAYAAEHKVPLTVERLAAELAVPVSVLRRYLEEEYTPPPAGRAVVEEVRRAAGRATASVIEYALTRGTSPNMHMMYLKQYAGYGEGDAAPASPVIFSGEGDLT